MPSHIIPASCTLDDAPKPRRLHPPPHPGRHGTGRQAQPSPGPRPKPDHRIFIPRERVPFHGLKLYLLVDHGKFIHEVNLSPGSLHDLTPFLLLPLKLPEGVEL
ncbi:hypothetical protein Thermus77927_05640 [Thermus hydrothermalis]